MSQPSCRSSNYRVKRRRRREAKTDYKHRRNMLRQDCNSHGFIKTRMVVRTTNTRIIVSFVKAYVDGDRVICSADSNELKNYGVDFGLKNYFAAYATGLLCGRRLLATKKLDNVFEANTNVETKNEIEKADDRNPVRSYLDIGLARSSTGARVFAAMKGATDAGVQIPYSPKRLFGYNSETDELDGEKFKERVFSENIVKYMMDLRENDPEKYKQQFNQYIAKGINPEDIKEKLENCLKEIIGNPLRKNKDRPQERIHYPSRKPKLTAEEKKEKRQKKLAILSAASLTN